MSDEQAPQQLAAPPEPPVGDKWGDPISEERQRELQARLDAWAQQTDHGQKKGPFDSTRLSGADVSWLAERIRDNLGSVVGLHLETLHVNTLPCGSVAGPQTGCVR